MKRHVAAALILGTLAGVAAVQDAKIELLAQNREVGVEIRAPKSPGKDQMWEAKVGTGGVHKGSAVLVAHRTDPFTVEVNVTSKGGSDFMSEDMEQSWPKVSTIAEKARKMFTDAMGDKESTYTECKVVSEEAKAKLSGLPGSGCSHRIVLTDRKGEKHELIEYFVISNDTLYRVTAKFTRESFDRHWARDGQFILHNIKRCKIERK